MSDVVVLTHMLPTPFVVLPQVGGTALEGLEAESLVVNTYSSGVTEEAVELTL